NRTGGNLKSCSVGKVQTTSCRDVFPNGPIGVAQYGGGKVVEFDGDGKQFWEATVPQPISAARLPNGHTLVASHNTKQQVLVLDKDGKIVWEHTIAGHATRAWRR